MDLTRDVARHDDVNTARHVRDKREKEIRDRTTWIPVPTVEVGAHKPHQDGPSPAPQGAGWCFRVRGRSASIEDGPAYTRAALARSKALRRIPVILERDGKPRKDYRRQKAGIESIVVTLPPWAQPLFERMGRSRQDHLMLHLIERIAPTAARHGRPLYGGGLHLDTRVAHLHLHLEKQGPKAQATRCGPWSTSTDRIRRKFPALLPGWKIEQLEENLSKRREEDLIDLALTRALDVEVEKWAAEEDPAGYAADCLAYARAKKRRDEVEHAVPLLRGALLYAKATGVWPLAWTIMRPSLARLIPKEIRAAVFLSIRAAQVIKNPGARLAPELLRSAEALLRSIEMTGPQPRR
jgi:hypothetical protein